MLLLNDWCNTWNTWLVKWTWQQLQQMPAIQLSTSSVTRADCVFCTMLHHSADNCFSMLIYRYCQPRLKTSWKPHVGCTLTPFRPPPFLPRYCFTHVLPIPLILYSFPFPLKFSKKIWGTFPYCPAKKWQPVAKVGGEQIQLVYMISNVGRDASHGPHRVAAPMATVHIRPRHKLLLWQLSQMTDKLIQILN